MRAGRAGSTMQEGAAGPRTDHHVGDPAAPVLLAVGVGHDGQGGLLQLVRGLEGWKDRGAWVRTEETSACWSPALPRCDPPPSRLVRGAPSATFQSLGGGPSPVPHQAVCLRSQHGWASSPASEPLRPGPAGPCVWAGAVPPPSPPLPGGWGTRRHFLFRPFLAACVLSRSVVSDCS